MTLPSGRVLSYDDRFLPQKPGMKEIGMGLLGQATGPIMGLGTLYGASKLGLLGGGGAGAAAGGAGALGAGGAAELASIPGIAGNAGVYGATTGGTGALEGLGLGSLSSTMPSIYGAGGLLGAYDLLSNPHRSRGISGLEGAASGALLGSAILPGPGTLVGGLLGGIGGSLFGGHKSTKQRTKEKFDKLLDSTSNQDYKNMIESAKQQSLDAKDNYELTNKDLGALSNTYAPIKTYGEDWVSLSDEQRRAIMEKALEENLIESSKGDYQFTDEERAKAIYDEIVKNKISSGI